MKTKRRSALVFSLIILLAAAVRLVSGAFFENRFDIGSYNIPWAIYGSEDPFGIYGETLSQFFLDYPPIIPFCLTFFGKAILAARESGVWQLEMLYVKLVPIIFDIATVVLIYLISKNYKIKHVWLPAFLWAVNPAAIYNCAFWGQTDCILLFFVIAMSWAIARDMPYAASIAFAFGCLSKLQMAYFAPVLILWLFCRKSGFIRSALALLSGIAVGFLGWLPFMRRGEWLALPWRIYFGGFEKYKDVNMGAANIYAFADWRNLTDTDILFWNISYKQVSTVLMLLIMLFLAVYFIKRLNGFSLSVNAATMIYCCAIFLFTTRQHERYQIPAIAFALLAWYETRDKRYAIITMCLSAVTFANEFIVLTGETHLDTLYEYIVPSLKAVAVLNIALFVYMLYTAFKTQKIKGGVK